MKNRKFRCRAAAGGHDGAGVELAESSRTSDHLPVSMVGKYSADWRIPASLQSDPESSSGKDGAPLYDIFDVETDKLTAVDVTIEADGTAGGIVVATVINDDDIVIDGAKVEASIRYRAVVIDGALSPTMRVYTPHRCCVDILTERHGPYTIKSKTPADIAIVIGACGDIFSLLARLHHADWLATRPWIVLQTNPLEMSART